MIAHLLKQNVSMVHKKRSAHAHAWCVYLCNVDFLQGGECLDPHSGLFWETTCWRIFTVCILCLTIFFLNSSLLLLSVVEKGLCMCVYCVTDSHISRVNWNPQIKRDIFMISSLSCMFILLPGIGPFHLCPMKSSRFLLKNIFPFSGLHMLSHICITINQN